MGSVVQLMERSTDAAGASAGVIGCNIVEVPFREVRYRIAQTTSTCEVLRQSIDSMQRALKTLEGLVARINDHHTREKLRHQMKSANEALLLRLTELSSIDRMLEAALRRTHRP